LRGFLGFGFNYQLSSKNIAPPFISSEGPNAITDINMMEEWVGLVQVITSTHIQVAVVIV
jgi:hypothetical protein